MKRFVVLLLSMLILLHAHPVLSAAALESPSVTYPAVGGNIYFNTATGTVTGCDSTVTEVVIPEVIADTAVSAIGDSAFFSHSLLQKVSLPKTVVIIDQKAFLKCTALKEVNLPENLHTLGYAAFRECASLERIDIPDSVSTMGSDVFEKCTALKEVSFSEGMSTIPASTFSGCAAMEKVEIPNSITKIEAEAFHQCQSLKTLYLPDSVVEVGDRAFIRASALEDLRLSNNLQVLGRSAFAYAGALKELKLPASITSMGAYCFRECGVRELTIPGTVQLGESAFASCRELEKLTLEEGISFIPPGAFESATSLKELSLPSTLTRIQSHAFSFSALETLVIPAKVQLIDTQAFVRTESLLSVGFLGDRPSIRAYAFDLIRSEAYYPNPNLRFYRLESAQGWDDAEALLWDGVNLPVVYPDSYTVLEFTDVSRNAWYANAVEYVATAKLMNGTSATSFAPDETMTRAMLVTVLWRYAGSPAVGTNSFSDVPNDSWYTAAVAWAAETGVVSGIGEGKFAPNGNITREQMATILYRYSNYIELDTTARTDLSTFPDTSSISGYAKEAINWAVALGLINGIQNGNTVTLAPQGNATRAQVAAILMRYIESLSAERSVSS